MKRWRSLITSFLRIWNITPLQMALHNTPARTSCHELKRANLHDSRPSPYQYATGAEHCKDTYCTRGVRLHRAFGYDELPLFDPFLMLDDFRAKSPHDYLPGFP
jgi:hypothetical protein